MGNPTSLQGKLSVDGKGCYDSLTAWVIICQCSGTFNFLINFEILHAKFPLQLHKDKQLQLAGAQHSPSPWEGV